jgi:hypothetical protein
MVYSPSDRITKSMFLMKQYNQKIAEGNEANLDSLHATESAPQRHREHREKLRQESLLQNSTKPPPR